MLNEEAYEYMRERGLSATLIARLAEQPACVFADQDAWSAKLEWLGFTELAIAPNPVTIAIEGAIWGSIYAHEFLHDTVLLSDDAGQFNIGLHALCWVHAERLVHKLDTFTDQHRVAQQRVRGLIWRFYADLKEYRRAPTAKRRLALRLGFDRIFCLRTGLAALDRLLARLHANKAELLMACSGLRSRFITTAPKTISDATSQGEKSALAHAAIAAVIVATPSLDLAKHAPSSAWHFGTISAVVSRFPATPASHRCQSLFDARKPA